MGAFRCYGQHYERSRDSPRLRRIRIASYAMLSLASCADRYSLRSSRRQPNSPNHGNSSARSIAARSCPRTDPIRDPLSRTGSRVECLRQKKSQGEHVATRLPDTRIEGHFQSLSGTPETVLLTRRRERIVCTLGPRRLSIREYSDYYIIKGY